MNWLLKTASRRRRGAVSLEAILAFPLLMFLFGAVSQVLLISQARSYVEMAAYATARSAMVHKCPPPEIVAQLSTFSGLSAFDCTDQPQKWEDAARWALVAASSTSRFAQARGCPDIRAGRELVMGTGHVNGHDEAVSNAICYAFEEGNVVVEADWDRSLLNVVSSRKSVPMRATVRYKYPLSTPFRIWIGQDRGDNTYWIEGEATVELS